MDLVRIFQAAPLLGLLRTLMCGLSIAAQLVEHCVWLDAAVPRLDSSQPAAILSCFLNV